MKVLIKTLVLLAGLQLNTAMAEVRSAEDYFFDQTLGDFSEELVTAKEEGKKGIFLFFEMDDCPFCQRMKHSVLNQSHVQDFFHEKFLNFSVDIEGDIEITAFDGRVLTQKEFSVKDHRVRATPVMVFFNLQGKAVTRYVGPVSNVEEFMMLGDYVVKERYKDISFIRYKREKKSNQKKHAES